MSSGLQLDDLVYAYPPITAANFQTMISAKQEFRELASPLREPTPKRGALFKHQMLIRRYMLQYNDIFIFHRTGTGKTCTIFGTTEQFKIALVNAMADFINNYIQPQRTNIKRVYFLTSNSTLVDEVKFQLACRCTNGEYLTRQVLASETSKQRKNNLTRAIKTYYDIMTYSTFAESLLKKNYTDDQLREEFSDTMYIVDEVQRVIVPKINEDALANEEDDTEIAISRVQAANKLRTYTFLHRLFHLVERRKVMLLSATPMTNDVSEIGAVMNLILPLDLQMGDDFPYRTATLDDVRSRFQGRISFIRESNTGAIPVFQGEVIKANLQVAGGKTVPSQSIIYVDEMSTKQADVVRSARDVRSSFHNRERQAANFVFPDGSYGRTGFNRYVQLASDDDKEVYVADRRLLPYLRDLNRLQELSAKFSSVIRLCNEPRQSCFVFSNYKSGAGVYLLGVCFQAQGYEQFLQEQSVFTTVNVNSSATRSFCDSSARGEVTTRRITIAKKPRFAIFSSDTTPGRRDTILELFNSYENRHGEYIKVLIGSPISQVGINLANVLQVHVVGQLWNQTGTYQAISRAIRATSHDALLQEERERLAALGQDPFNARILIKIYQHAAVDRAEQTNVDVSMYILSEIKDYEIRQMERLAKRMAIDCQLHYERNVGLIGPVKTYQLVNGQVQGETADRDGSATCDYQECKYKCADPPPDTVDYSSYQVLYLQELLMRISTALRQIFRINPVITYTDLYRLIREDSEIKKFLAAQKLTLLDKWIDMAIERSISTKMRFIDRYGFTTYLLEGPNQLLYLQREYPLRPSDPDVATYVRDLNSVLSLTLREITRQVNQPTTTQMVSALEQTDPESPEFDELLNKLPLEEQQALLERTIIDQVTNPPGSAFSQAIIKYFVNDIYSFYEPTQAIAENQRYSEEIRRGRRRESGISVLPNIETLPLLQTGPRVILHTLANQQNRLTSFGISATVFKIKGPIRILVIPGTAPPQAGMAAEPSAPSRQLLTWRFTTPFEQPIYSELIRRFLEDKYRRFLESPIYGSIFRDGKFRIHDNVNIAQRAKTGVTRGLVCSSFLLYELIAILRYFDIEPPEVSGIEDYDDSAFIESLKSLNIPDRVINRLSPDDLRYYYRWASTTNRGEMCDILLDWFRENELLLTFSSQ